MRLQFLSTLVFLYCLHQSSVVCFDITILHTNDVHSAVEPVNERGSYCKEENHDKCYGGALRTQIVVENIRARDANVLLVDSGDFSSGTVWSYQYGVSAMVKVMSHIRYDAVALGNHEFGEGPEGLLPFRTASFDRLSCNLNASAVPKFNGISEKFATYDFAGERIGVIGFTPEETEDVSNPVEWIHSVSSSEHVNIYGCDQLLYPGSLSSQDYTFYFYMITEDGDLTFDDVATSIQDAVDKLTAEGVNKIIALGRLQFGDEKGLAARVKGLDVIVGGFQTGYLYAEKMHVKGKESELPYPWVAQGSDDGTVLIVETMPKYRNLGVLTVTFDPEGQVTNWGGQPVVLDSSVEEGRNTNSQDYPALENLIEDLAVPVTALRQQVIGETYQDLDASKKICRLRECNLGNLIADGMRYLGSDDPEWRDISIAMIHAGGIRNSIDTGLITVGEVVTVLPFSTTIVFLEIPGQAILDALRYAASKWQLPPNRVYGGFFQVSGLKIVYDMTREVNDRVVSVEVVCPTCPETQLTPLNVADTYKVAFSSFILGGGEGMAMIRDNVIRKHETNVKEADCLKRYIEQITPVDIGVSGRIEVISDKQIHRAEL